MALHIMPDTGAHAPTCECGCGPVRVEGERVDGTHGATYLHRPATYLDDDDDQEGRTDAAASD